MEPPNLCVSLLFLLATLGKMNALPFKSTEYLSTTDAYTEIVEEHSTEITLPNEGVIKEDTTVTALEEHKRVLEYHKTNQTNNGMSESFTNEPDSDTFEGELLLPTGKMNALPFESTEYLTTTEAYTEIVEEHSTEITLPNESVIEEETTVTALKEQKRVDKNHKHNNNWMSESLTDKPVSSTFEEEILLLPTGKMNALPFESTEYLTTTEAYTEIVEEHSTEITLPNESVIKLETTVTALKEQKRVDKNHKHNNNWMSESLTDKPVSSTFEEEILLLPTEQTAGRNGGSIDEGNQSVKSIKLNSDSEVPYIFSIRPTDLGTLLNAEDHSALLKKLNMEKVTSSEQYEGDIKERPFRFQEFENTEGIGEVIVPLTTTYEINISNETVTGTTGKSETDETTLEYLIVSTVPYNFSVEEKHILTDLYIIDANHTDNTEVFTLTETLPTAIFTEVTTTQDFAYNATLNLLNDIRLFRSLSITTTEGPDLLSFIHESTMKLPHTTTEFPFTSTISTYSFTSDDNNKKIAQNENLDSTTANDSQYIESISEIKKEAITEEKEFNETTILKTQDMVLKEIISFTRSSNDMKGSSDNRYIPSELNPSFTYEYDSKLNINERYMLSDNLGSASDNDPSHEILDGTQSSISSLNSLQDIPLHEFVIKSYIAKHNSTEFIQPVVEKSSRDKFAHFTENSPHDNGKSIENFLEPPIKFEQTAYTTEENFSDLIMLSANNNSSMSGTSEKYLNGDIENLLEQTHIPIKFPNFSEIANILQAENHPNLLSKLLNSSISSGAIEKNVHSPVQLSEDLIANQNSEKVANNFKNSQEVHFLDGSSISESLHTSSNLSKTMKSNSLSFSSEINTLGPIENMYHNPEEKNLKSSLQYLEEIYEELNTESSTNFAIDDELDADIQNEMNFEQIKYQNKLLPFDNTSDFTQWPPNSVTDIRVLNFDYYTEEFGDKSSKITELPYFGTRKSLGIINEDSHNKVIDSENSPHTLHSNQSTYTSQSLKVDKFRNITENSSLFPKTITKGALESETAISLMKMSPAVDFPITDKPESIYPDIDVNKGYQLSHAPEEISPRDIGLLEDLDVTTSSESITELLIEVAELTTKIKDQISSFRTSDETYGSILETTSATFTVTSTDKIDENDMGEIQSTFNVNKTTSKSDITTIVTLIFCVLGMIVIFAVLIGVWYKYRGNRNSFDIQLEEQRYRKENEPQKRNSLK